MDLHNMFLELNLPFGRKQLTGCLVRLESLARGGLRDVWLFQSWTSLILNLAPWHMIDLCSPTDNWGQNDWQFLGLNKTPLNKTAFSAYESSNFKPLRILKMSGNSVYLGIWINHGHGSILGATLTIPARYGVLLTNFLALFVSWTGIQVWTILCYCMHLLASTGESKDIMQHQKQVLLRNGLADYSFFWKLIKVSWAQSRVTRMASLRKNVPLALLALSHAILFAVAGIFSSRVTTTNSEALVRSPSGSCGQPVFDMVNILNPDVDFLAKANVLFTISNWAYDRSRDYANACYNPVGTNFTAASCDAYVQPRLQFTVLRDEPCPFQDGCVAPAITISSGYIDSEYHLGVNGAASERIQFQKRLTCAPLEADSYAGDWKSPGPTKIFPWDPDNLGGALYKFYDFGNLTTFGFKSNYTFAEGNFTQSVSRAYTTDVRQSFVNKESFNSFDPIPALNRRDADVSLWSLRNRALYSWPVHDPWYKATTQQDMGLLKLYTADSPVSAIGCIEQYSFCNKQNCTTLGGLFQLTEELVVELLGYNSKQLSTFRLIWGIAWVMRLSGMVFQLQDYMLLAKSQVWGEYKASSPLPDNQWQLEVENAFNISLAGLQILPVIHSAPPLVEVTPNTTYDEYITSPNSTNDQLICLNQKIKSNDIASFSLFGVLFILISGTLLILGSHFLPKIVERSQTRSSSPLSQYKRDEWNSNEILNLHKIALESHGIGPCLLACETPILERDHGIIRKFKLPWLGEETRSGIWSPDRTSSDRGESRREDSRVELVDIISQ